MATLSKIEDDLSSLPAATIKAPAAESVLIVGDSAALLSPTADYLQRARDALSQNIGADLTYRSIVTDMRMLEPLRLGAGSVLHTGGLGAKEAMLTIDAASSLAGLGSLAEKIERPLQELALCFGDFARSAETAARQFIETARLSNFAGLGDMLLSPAERAAIADMGQPNRLARQVIEGFNADEQRAAWPPPQSGNFGIQPAQPEPLGGDLLAIAHDILSGRVNSREQVVKRLLMIEQGSQQPPQWEYIEMIALDYEHNGHRYQNMTAFAAKYRLSRATVDNYLKHYEAATGKQVRPGQGRAKRGGKWQQ